VLGGGSDIGQAIAARLVDDGAEEVILAGRRPGRLEAAAARLSGNGMTSVETAPFDADDLGMLIANQVVWTAVLLVLVIGLIFG